MLQIEPLSGLPEKAHRQFMAAVRHRSSANPSSTMSTGLDMLEKNMDKLGELFSKGKKAGAGAFRGSLFGGSRSGTPAPSSDSASQSFPYPSFIRPTSTRMLARDEPPQAAQPTRRAQSLPETSTSNLPAQIPTGSPTIGISQSPQVPRRTSSLFHRRANASIDGMLEFSFAKKTTRSPPSSLRSASPTSPLSWPGRKCSVDTTRELLRLFPSHRPDTPPPSDHEVCCPSPSRLRTMKSFPPLSSRAGASPEPEMSPVPSLTEDSSSDRSVDDVSSQEVQRPKHNSLGNPETSHIDVAQLRKALSDSNLSAATPLQLRDPVLTEPSLDDFLSLSDDDIADGGPVTSAPSKPPTCGLPPDPPTPSTATVVVVAPPVLTPTAAPAPVAASALAPAPVLTVAPAQASKSYRLLTLSSPLVSRPVTAAAFEAARIAARYKFDLVYVVNLWPKNLVGTQYKASESTRTARLTPVDGSSDGQASLACINPRSGMTGRLLAGYGLPSVMSPFRISAPVHQKVLRTDGWLEYRSDNAEADEFSRGYSCSFYTGIGLQGGTSSAQDPSTSPKQSPKKKRSQPNNRGIVFAAYRLPRLDGTTVGSEISELDSLYRDAESLVEMLIDIHSTQRARLIARYDADETGPMPTRTQPPSLSS